MIDVFSPYLIGYFFADILAVAGLGTIIFLAIKLELYK